MNQSKRWENVSTPGDEPVAVSNCSATETVSGCKRSPWHMHQSISWTTLITLSTNIYFINSDAYALRCIKSSTIRSCVVVDSIAISSSALTVKYYHTILTTDLPRIEWILSYDWQKILKKNNGQRKKETDKNEPIMYFLILKSLLLLLYTQYDLNHDFYSWFKSRFKSLDLRFKTNPPCIKNLVSYAVCLCNYTYEYWPDWLSISTIFLSQACLLHVFFYKG